MTTAADRVMARIETGPPAFSDALLRAWRAEAGFAPPPDLLAHWRRWGTGDGSCGPDDSGNYLRLFSMADALDVLTGYRSAVPPGFAPIGDDGGPCLLVHGPDHGYGWLDVLNQGPADLIPVAPTLEALFAALEAGTA